MLDEKVILKKLVHELEKEDPFSWSYYMPKGPGPSRGYYIFKGPFTIRIEHIVEVSDNWGDVFDLGYWLEVWENNKEVAKSSHHKMSKIRRLYHKLNGPHEKLQAREEQNRKIAQERTEQLEKQVALKKMEDFLRKGK
jgi:hypothetical protein